MQIPARVSLHGSHAKHEDHPHTHPHRVIQHVRMSYSLVEQRLNTKLVLLQELLHKKLDALQAGHDVSPS